MGFFSLISTKTFNKSPISLQALPFNKCRIIVFVLIYHCISHLMLLFHVQFGCCTVDSNNQKGSYIVAYDPITNSSYYAPMSSTSPTPIYLQHGMYDQDTMSTILSPIHEGGQRQLMTFMNMIPVNGQRNSSSCGSVHSGGNYSNNPQPVMNNNISPAGSVSATDSNNQGSSNMHSDSLTSPIEPNQTCTTLLNSFTNNGTTNTSKSL